MPAVTTMFTISSQDQSQAYLAYLFGTVGNVLTPDSTTTTLNLMGTMFKVLNMTALTVGVLIVIYTTIMGVIATAHEGEALGKKWSGLWVPVRMVVGVIFLFPAKTGYSVLQIFLMWIILQGVGAADTLWSTALNYINLTGSPYAVVTIPSIGVKQQIQNLFQGLTCQATVALSGTPGITNPGNNGEKLYYCDQVPTDPSCRVTAAALPDVGQTVYSMGPSANCGTMTYYKFSDNSPCDTDTSTINGVVCNAQVKALSSIVTLLGGVANNFAKADQAYQSFYASAAPPTGNSEFVQLYCNAQGLSGAGACCVQTQEMIATFALAMADYQARMNNYVITHMGPMPVKPTLRCSSGFPVASTSDLTNSDNGAIRDLIWPYFLKPLVTVDSSNAKSADFITNAVNIYIGTITNDIMNFYVSQTAKSALPDWLQQAQDLGWILAGGYYYQMATMSGGNNKNAFQLPVLVVDTSDPDIQSDSHGQPKTLSKYRNNYSAAGTLVSLVTTSGQAPSVISASSAPGMTSISGYSSGVSAGIMGAFMDMLTGGSGSALNSSPLAKLVAFGQGMMITGDVIFAVFLAVMLALLLSLGWEPFVLGTGLKTPLSSVSVGMAIIFTPIVTAILAFVYSVGGLLAVYVPLIPYIVFTMGAIGWLIAVIEAMAAAPFVALGILSPGEHHGMLGKAEPALLATLNIFLRPSLMVFAMMASMLLSSVAVALVNAAFQNVVNSISPTFGSFVEPFIFIAAYTALIISVLNKTFALIHIIPDGVLKWIGGHHAPGGGETGQEALQATKEKTGAAAGAMGGAAAGAAAKPGAALEKGAERSRMAADRKEEREEAARTAGGGAGNIQAGAPPPPPPPEKKP